MYWSHGDLVVVWVRAPHRSVNPTGLFRLRVPQRGRYGSSPENIRPGESVPTISLHTVPPGLLFFGTRRFNSSTPNENAIAK